MYKSAAERSFTGEEDAGIRREGLGWVGRVLGGGMGMLSAGVTRSGEKFQLASCSCCWYDNNNNSPLEFPTITAFFFFFFFSEDDPFGMKRKSQARNVRQSCWLVFKHAAATFKDGDKVSALAARSHPL